ALVVFAGNILDLLDGMVARKFHKVTSFGGFLDSTMDRFSDFLVITAFSFGGIVRWDITALLFLFSFLTSYIRSRGELASQKHVSFAVGWIERPERLVLIFISLIAYVFLPHVMISGYNLLE